MFLWLTGCFTSPAECDGDGDGHLSEACGGFDCDDARADIAPWTSEVGGDGIDADCDGRDGIVRRELDDFEAPDPAWVGDVWVADGALHVDGTARLTHPLGMGTSRPSVVTEAHSSGDCRLRLITRSDLDGSTWVDEAPIPGSGTVVVTATQPLPQPLQAMVAVVCDEGQAQLDWLSVQNGPEAHPPISEHEVAWEGVGPVGGGAFNRVVLDGDDWLTFSDVGGLHRLRDDHWASLSADLIGEHNQGVWDAYRREDGTLVALTGRVSDSRVAGGLWASDDDGETWWGITEELGFYGRGHNCTTSNPDPARGGGAVMVDLGVGLLFPSNDLGSEGVWLWDGADVCPIMDVPMATVGAMVRTEGVVVIGFKGLRDAEDSLWECQIIEAQCDDLDVTCQPLGSGVDVRDMVVDPLDESRLIIADGGRQPDKAGDCRFDGGTVFTLDLAGPTLAEIPGLEPMLAGGNAFDALGSEVTTVAMHEDGAVFAAFSGGRSLPYTRDGGPNGRIWRWDGGWQALSGTDRDARASAIDPGDTWLSDQNDIELWAPALASDLVIDGDTLIVADGYGLWVADDPLANWNDVDSELHWTLASEPQTTVAPDITMVDGTLQIALSDHTFSRTPDKGRAEISCVWNRLGQHGRAVDVADGVTWLATSADTHGAVFRSEDQGETWCFQGSSDTQVDAGVAVCKGEVAADGGWPACDYDTASFPGVALQGWGPPMDLDAWNGEVAVVAFQETGLGYTMDGGETWNLVPGFAHDACSETAFFGTNAWIQLDPGSVVHDKNDFVLHAVVGGANCGIAEVIWEPDGATWSTMDLADCAVDGDNLSGIALDSGGEVLWVWSSLHYRAEGTFGGLCHLERATGRVTQVLDPDHRPYDIGAVAPHPYLADVVFVQPRVTATTALQCINGTGSACWSPQMLALEPVKPLFQQRWSATNIPTIGLPTTGGIALSIAPNGDLLLGTHGLGAWRAPLQ